MCNPRYRKAGTGGFLFGCYIFSDDCFKNFSVVYFVRQYETTSTKECKNVDLPCKLQMLNKQIRIYRKH